MAAESEGTTFPELVIIHPDGIPAVATDVAVDMVVEVAPATHGQPVIVEVSSLLPPCPRPAGMEGEADVIAEESAVATVVAAEPTLPLTVPPTASIDVQLPVVSPYL